MSDLSDRDKVEKVEEKLDGGVDYYDPPSGWRYGFPKKYKPLPGESIEDTLIRDGYPASMKDLAEYCRFWKK